MKVFIITKLPFPNGLAATNRIRCYAKAIEEGGLDCEIVVFGFTEREGEKIRNSMANGTYEGIPFRYIGGSTTGPRSRFLFKILQILNLKRGEWYLKRNVKKGDALLIFWGGKYKMTRRSVKIAHHKGAYCVCELCELPRFDEDMTLKHIYLRNRAMEKLLPLMDGIISISNALRDLAVANTLSSCKHIRVPIIVEFDKFSITKTLTEGEVPFVFHAGTLTQQKDGILGMIEAFGMAMQRLKRPIKYILTGNINTSSHPREILGLIEKYHLENAIEFVGYLNRDQVKEYLSKASLVISNRPKSKQDYYGFSTKVGEYLASGTPMITTHWGEAANWLKDGESAYIIEPENIEALADAIVRVFTNPEEAHCIGLAGQELCRRSFDYHNWSQPLVQFLKSLNE